MLIVCPQCGFSREVPKDRLQGRSVAITCPKCQCKFRLYANGDMDILEDRHNQGDTEEDKRIVASRAYEREKRRWEEENSKTAPLETGIAWDIAPNGVSWLDAFFRTVIGVMFSAQKFFSRLNRHRPVFRALIFYLIICVFQITVERLWLEGLIRFFNTASLDDPQLETLLAMLAPKSGFFLTLLVRTAINAFQLYLISFLMELALRIAAPGKSSFGLVFQILAYSGAPYLLCVIPGLGSLAALVWSIGCIAIGCKVAMKLDWGQVLVGFLPPLLLHLAMLCAISGQLAA